MLAALSAGPAVAQGAVKVEPLTVYAAASLENVVDTLGAAYAAHTQQPVRGVYAGTPVLVRQVLAGAPADLVISANPDWIDHLDREGYVAADGQRIVARNALVAVVPKASPVTENDGPRLGRAWIPHRLALGEPDSVPVGIYARTALTTLGRWTALKDSVIPAASVRVALAWTARGEADAAIVYATDAALSNDVRVVWRLPLDAHPPIVYVAAVVQTSGAPVGATGAARAFLDFLLTQEAQGIFARFGFLPAKQN